MLKYIQHPCHITYIGYVMPEKERANMRKFFIQKYKTLILFSYISSAFLTLMFVLNVIIDVPYAGKSYLCLTISYINIVYYVLNYNCLCKRRKIDKNVKGFIIGFLPIICAAVAQTVMFVWFVSIKMIRVIPLVIVFDFLFLPFFLAVMWFNYKDESVPDEVDEETQYESQFDFDDTEE